jgi:uncharacterized protein (DUF302 family)
MNRQLTSLLAAVILFASSFDISAEDPIVTKQVEGTFAEVSSNVRQAILGKGLKVAHVLNAADMLDRTGESFGYKDKVYREAETFEFCSAALSHKLARSNPDNIVLCPFAISVYVVDSEPEQIRISYRIPVARPGSEMAVKEVVTLIESIIEDASW